MFVAGKGMVRKWIVKNRNNHYLDAIALACAAAGCLGVRVIPRDSIPAPQQATSTATKQPFLTPHGQPFLATQRN